ncbi:hypothetical protein C1645_850591 [Glomus cerebriforme]|uniref:Uncharacterized protein n=1 Tax=Glomus cerebriforme TaxID=658196 RepID=A0A397TSL7_9GLOM|nr:hypothetical protein C1645_850591 [Glomus cerebriforme]
MLTRLFISHYVFKKHLWKKTLVWTCNYSSLPANNKDISEFDIDLTELKDFPETKKIVIQKIFDFKNNLWIKTFEQCKDSSNMMWKKEDTETLEREKAKKLASQEKNEFEKMNLLKEQENLIQLSKFQKEVEQHAQSLLQIRQRNPFEFIYVQILEKNKNVIYTKPVNKVLEYFSQNKKFTNLLQKACRDNNLHYCDVQKCVGDLHYIASKFFHAHCQEIIISEQSWSPNEILLLGVIFYHFKIPFLYYDSEYKLANYPYKF